MLEKFIFDAVERERARRVEAERLQIARQHLHGRDSAILDRRDKFAARREGKVGAAPEAEALCISEVLDGRRAGRGNIDRKSVVQGKRVSVRVDLGGRRIVKTKKRT